MTIRKWQAIRVGVPWEEAGYANYDGYVWYRIDFTVPERWQQQDENGLLSLSLGFIDDADMTYFNGVQVGATGSMPPDYKTAYYTRRFYRVPTSLVRGGQPNVIAVRVYDDNGPGGLYKGPYTLQLPQFEDLIGIKFKLENSNGIYFSPDPLPVTISRKTIHVRGYEPEKIVSPLTREADFSEFWKKRKQELADVAPEFKMTKDDRSTDRVDG